MSDSVDPKKLKVAELREELKARGLETKGNKAQLVKRLEKCLAAAEDGSEAAEADDSVLDNSALETSGVTDDAPNDVQEQQDASEEDVPKEVDEQESPAEETATEKEPEEPVIEKEPEEPVIEKEPEEPVIEKEPEEPVIEKEPEEPVIEKKPEEPEPSVDEDVTESHKEPQDSENNMEELPQEEEQNAEPEVKKEAKSEVEENNTSAAPESIEPVETSEKEPEIKMEQSTEDAKDEQVEQAKKVSEENNVKEETGDAEMKEESEEDGGAGGPEPEAEYQVMDAIEDSETVDEKNDEVKKDDDRRGHKRRHSRSRSRDRYHRSPRRRSRSPRRRSRTRSHGRERRRSHSAERRRRSRSADRRNQEVPENEDWLTATNVVMDRFNCDLNMRIDEAGYKGTPITVEGFAFMWSGVRANYGITKGKAAYEVEIKSHLNVEHLPEEETSRHVVRVGWSTDSASTQLGEEPLSYGYGGTGKASTDCKFKDFGEKFGEGDVIAAYVDFDNEGPILLTYSKNGEDLGTCFEIEREELGDQALFPHVLSKNSEFLVNFGQCENPMKDMKEGFTFINDVPEGERVRGSVPPAKKEDCEIIMMCGLPAAGKTVWATKKAQECKEKKYSVLGTNNIIDKMKVMGLPRKKNYAGRWDVLIDKATKCLTRMLEIASKKKRNYVVDQTNVYPSAQRRKMRPFEGFQRIAVVIVPSDEEYKKRREAQQKEEGKDVPDDAILEMKANFALPEEGPTFDKVEFIELEREEGQKLVEQYNKEGQAVFPPDQKRWRRDDRFGGDRNFRGRDRYDNRDRSRGGSYNSYSRDRGYFNSNDRRGGGGRGGGGGGGYNDKRGGGYMGYSRDDRQKVSHYDSRDRSDSYRDRNSRRDDRSSRDGGRSHGGSYNKGGGGSYSGGQSNNWNNQSSGSGSGWSGNQGSWGNQGWGQQGYNQGWGGQWSGYQNQGSTTGQQQGWGQNYSGYWPSQQSSSGQTGWGQQGAAQSYNSGTTSSTPAATGTQASSWYGGQNQYNYSQR